MRCARALACIAITAPAEHSSATLSTGSRDAKNSVPRSMLLCGWGAMETEATAGWRSAWTRDEGLEGCEPRAAAVHCLSNAVWLGPLELL